MTAPFDLKKPAGQSRDWLWALVLLLAVILVYSPVWRAGYIWDDNALLTANPVIIGPLGLTEIWTTRSADVCPLTITTFWIEHQIWGLAPFPYHLVTVLLHGACAIVLWRILFRLQCPGAWFAAALWALHPVMVESVAWVTEMKNTESGLFFLLSILFFVRELQADQIGTKGSWNYALTLIFAALAMASKSSTVVLPLILCLVAWWMEGRWQWRLLVKMLPIFAMSLVAGIATILVEHGTFATEPRAERSLLERLATSGDATWFYLGKLVWPHPLITIYLQWKIDPDQWTSYLPLAAAIVVLLIFWLNRRSWARTYFFAFAFFLVALFPALGLINNSFFRYAFVADHFQYLASMGPLALAGAALVKTANIFVPSRKLQSALGVGMLALFGILSWHQALAYQNQEKLWQHTLAWNPGSREAHVNLGNVLLDQGQVDEAIAHYQKALEINPHFSQAYYNLGLALSRKGRVDEAISSYRKALENFPEYALAHNSLGIALQLKGRDDEAMEQFEQALHYNPSLANAHCSLGLILAQKGDVDAAIAEFQKALAVNPNYAEAHYNLGAALFQKGQVDNALVHFQKVLEINPNSAVAHNSVGVILAQKDQLNEAIAQFTTALKLQPDDKEAQQNLAAAQKASQSKPAR